jgi:hypothetical protein
MYIVFYVKYQLFLSDFNDLNFLDGFLKNAQMSNFIKIDPVEAELFHVDGWTDRHDKARSHFFVIWQMCVTMKISSAPLQPFENSVRTCVRQFTSSFV